MRKPLFLYRLYQYSPLAFWLAIIFIMIYSVTFYKKMDMVFFPVNSMYATPVAEARPISTYQLSVNGKPVRITDKLYWKKDFLEASLASFVNYQLNDQRTLLELYHGPDQSLKGRIIRNHLIPDKFLTSKWPLWFAAFAGEEISYPAKIDIRRFDIVFINRQMQLIDSLPVFSGTYP